MLRAELSWFTAHCWAVVPVSLKASEGSLIFTVGALSTHLCVELSAQTWRQSHCCSLSTPVMSHNAIMGFAQRGKLPEKSCQLEFDLSYNNDADQIIFYPTRLHTEQTQVASKGTACTPIHFIWWSPKSKVLARQHFILVTSTLGGIPQWEAKGGDSASPSSVWTHSALKACRYDTQTKLVLEMPILEPDFFFPSSSNLIKCISSYQPSLFYSFWLYSYMTIGI